MSFIVSNSSPSRIGTTAPEIEASDFYGSSFKQGAVESMFSSIYRMSEYQSSLDYDPVLNPFVNKEEANHYAQQEGLSITFDQDPTMDEMNLLIGRAQKARERQTIIEAGNPEGGWGSMRSYGQFGTQFLGSALTPVDLPLMFIPIVGTGSKAAGAARAGWFARGLVTEEALAARGLAMRGYTAAIIEGSVGQAITEVPLFISNQQSQVDYTANDFFANVAAGGAFGAGINTLRLAFKGAGSLMKTLSKETRESMGTAAMTDFLEGKPLDPGRYVNLDDEVSARRSSGELVEAVNRNDSAFKEKYATLSLKEKSIVDFNEGNKFVDNKGLPLVVYHGRTWEGDQFDPASLGKNTGAESAKEGFFFAGNVNTSQYYILRSRYQNDPRVSAIFDEMDDINVKIKEDPSTANEVLKERFQDLHEQVNEKLGIQSVFRDGGNVSAFLLSAKNPKIVDFEGNFHRPQAYSDIIKKAKADGHDAVVIKNTFDGGPLDDIYVVFDKESIRTAYDYRVARTAKQKLRANKQAVDNFSAREEEAKVQKQTKLEREIELGRTTKPEEKVRVREFPTDDDVARMQEEIDELNDMMWLTTDELNQVKGNTRAINHEVIKDLNNWGYAGSGMPEEAAESLENLRKEAYADPMPSDKPVYRTFEGITDLKVGDTLSPKQRGFAGWSEGTMQTDDWASDHGGVLIMDGKHVLIPHSKLREYVDKNKLEVYEYFDDDAESLIDDRLDYRVSKIENNRGLKIIHVESIGKAQAPIFSKHAEYRRPVYYKVWEQYLPKKEGDNPTWTAEEFAAAAAELHPNAVQIFDELFELDPSLREMKIGFDRDLDAINASGVYLAETDRINLATDSNVETIVHELVHSTAVRKWRQDLADVDPKLLYVTVRKGESYLKGLEEYAARTENKPMANLVEAYLETVKYHNKIDPKVSNMANNSWESFSNKVDEPHYGLLNFDEFITEALTNRTFQLYLNNIPSKSGTIYSYFVDAIKRLFKLDTKQSLLDDVLFNYSKMAETGPRAPGHYLTGMQTPKDRLDPNMDDVEFNDDFDPNMDDVVFDEDLFKMPKARNFDINKNVLAQTSNCLLNAL